MSEMIAEKPRVAETEKVADGIATVIFLHGEVFELPPVTKAQYETVVDLFLEPARIIETKEPVTV